MSALEQQIDDIYRQPLNEFVSARNALAKTVSKDEAKRVRALVKPTLVPWAVNQVYWRARQTYDRLMKSGEQLRKAQIAALEGRTADVRSAGEAHRRAIAEAVAEAERLASASGSKPAPDALMRTFEALSLATEPPEAPGRLTEALQPAGFEALAGVTPTAAPPKRSHTSEHAATPTVATTRSPASDGGRAAPQRGREDREKSREREREVAAAAREREEAARQARERDAALRKAEAKLARVEAAEQQARAAWERAHDELLEARRALAAVKSAT